MLKILTGIYLVILVAWLIPLMMLFTGFDSIGFLNNKNETGWSWLVAAWWAFGAVNLLVVTMVLLVEKIGSIAEIINHAFFTRVEKKEAKA